MAEPIHVTAQAHDAAREFVDGIQFVQTPYIPGGFAILLPIMGPDDRTVHYEVDAQGHVTQLIGLRDDIVTLNGSVFDMLRQVAETEEGDGRG